MPKDNEAKNLIINKLTKEQFKTVSDSSTNYEVYHIIDDAHYTETEIQNLLNAKQDVLTAGAGLEIKDGVISNIHSNPKWGDLQGDVFEQLDLKNALYANNIYENNGLVLTDKQGFNDVQKYARSTFDLSKFTVVGNPNITSDGVASGFSTSDFIQNTLNYTYTNNAILYLPFKTGSDVVTTQRIYFKESANNAITINNNKIVIIWEDVNSNVISTDWVPNIIEANKEYIAKIEDNGIKQIISILNVDFGVWKVLKEQDKISNLNLQGVLTTGLSISVKQPFLGSIDLKYFSITVDGVPVFTGNKTGLDVIKPDDYTVVGSPTISEDGVASGFSSVNYLTTQNVDFTSIKTFKIDTKFTTGTISTGRHKIIFHLYNSNNPNAVKFYEQDGMRNLCFAIPVSDSTYEVVNMGTTPLGTHTASFRYNGSSLNIYIDDVLKVTREIDTVYLQKLYNLLLGTSGNDAHGQRFTGSIDLNTFKIYVDGNLVYQPCLKIPYTESKTGSKIVSAYARDRVQDVYEQFGQANYYTLDEENKNFTLPMGEIYGMINSNLELKANDSDVLHLSGNETKSGNLTVTGTVTSNNFIGNLSGTATKANQDGNGLQINTNYMRRTIGDAVIPVTPTTPTALAMVGKQQCGNGNIAGGNLVALHKNTLYKCNERGSTITCNYDDKVANLGKSMCDGSFNGHYTQINPSTSFTSKPFVWEVTSPTKYEESDVCRLHIYSHRLTDALNVTDFKIEAYIQDTLTNSKKWVTTYEYSGESKNIAQTGFGLYKTGYSSTFYYSIFGIRLTISGSPDTVFKMSQVQIVASRGTETLADSLHCVSDAGGKIWGNLEVTGTVNGKCTKDGNGNVIVDTYATKTEVGGKQDTLTAGTGINISNNTISTTFTDTKVQSNVSNTNSNVPILLNNGTSATTNVALINSLINANPSTGTISAQHGKFGKSLTTYRYVASETPNTTYYWYKIYSSNTSDQIVNFEISAHGDANYPYFSKYTISISNYRATTTSVVVHNHGTTKNSDIKVAIDAQGNVYLQTNCIWGCNLNVNNTYGTATIPYENMGYSSFGVPVGFTSLGMLTNCGAMRLTKSTGEVQYSDVTTSSIADGVKAKSGQILYDWVGTKKEYETGIANGSISEDWICWITDDNAGTYETNKYDLFDVVIKDRILGYEESFGFGKLGTYVYKTAKLNEYFGYPDFYNKCLEEYNKATTTETVNGVTVKVNQNGHKFYNIANKGAIDTFYNSTGVAWFYGIDTTNERIFLPRNDYLTSYVENEIVQVDYDMTTTNNMQMRIPLADSLGRINMLFNGTSSSDNTEGLTGRNDANNFGAVRYTGQSYKTSDLPSGGTTSTVTPNLVNLDPNGTLYVDISNVKDTNRYAYMVVGNTLSDTSWVDVVTQVQGGVKELEDKTNEGIKTLSNASNALKQTQITNCLLEVPENIEYTLVNGVLTFKKGSIFTFPMGTSSPTHSIGTTLGNIWKIVDIQFENSKLFYSCELNKDTVVPVGDAVVTDRRVVFPSLYNSSFPFIFYLTSSVTSGTEPLTQSGVSYLSNSNIVGRYITSGWLTSEGMGFPVCIAQGSGVAGGGFASVDEVFNGFGYIGHHTFSYKGIKSLIPNGRNSDGTLKNIEKITTSINVRDEAGRGSWICFWDGTNILTYGVNNYFEQETEPTFAKQYASWFNPKENVMYSTSDYGTTWTAVYRMYLGVLKKTSASGDFVEFKPKQPFRAVDYNDIKDNVYIKETYQNGTSWYRVYSDGWCEQGGITSPWYRSTGNIITFLKKFKSKPTFICNLEVTTGEATEMRVTIGNTTNNAGIDFITNTQATVYIHGISGSGTDGGPVHWEAKGYIS